PWGGQIKITRIGSNWKLDAKGEKIKADADLWRMINDPTNPTEVAASDVHFALVSGAAKGARRLVAVYFDEAQVTVTF
ncbi:MAG: hypothetical protein HKP37_07215, partial [Boseongicola sp.]|nr:hypothetical protein [Boseongicola sp.]